MSGKTLIKMVSEKRKEQFRAAQQRRRDRLHGEGRRSICVDLSEEAIQKLDDWCGQNGTSRNAEIEILIHHVLSEAED